MVTPPEPGHLQPQTNLLQPSDQVSAVLQLSARTPMSVSSWRVLSQTSQANRLRVGPLVTPAGGSPPSNPVAVLAAMGRTAAI